MYILQAIYTISNIVNVKRISHSDFTYTHVSISIVLYDKISRRLRQRQKEK